MDIDFRRSTPSMKSHAGLRRKVRITELAEKLSAVCRGEADASLLDLYVRQRRTVNLEYVQEYSIKNLQRLNEKSEAKRQQNFDELRATAATLEGQRQFLLISSMIASVQRANAIT